jgi:hypothetical protein
MPFGIASKPERTYTFVTPDPAAFKVFRQTEA